MDETLRIIRHLYGEDPDPEDLLRRLEDDPAIARELREMQEVKTLLDRKPNPSPDPAVLDTLTQAAADAAAGRPVSGSTTGADPASDAGDDSESRRAPDRASRAPTSPAPSRAPARRSGMSRRLQQAAVVAVAVMLLVLGWWQMQPTAPASQTTANTQALQDLPPAARDLPEWDEGDDVVRLHRRLEVVNARSAPPSSWNSRSTLVPTESRRP